MEGLDAAQVLVVDDEWIIRNQVTRALKSVGISCDQAADGGDALSKFRKGYHQIVMTDLRMPHVNGHSLAVSLLAEPNPPDVVVLTGVSEPKLARDLLTRGVREVFFKPINYFELANRLKNMLAPDSDCASERSGVTDEGPQASETTTDDSSTPNLSREELETRLLNTPPQNTWLTMTLQWFDWHEIPDPPAAPHDYLEKQRCEGISLQRRRENRTTLAERAIGIPLNDDFLPVGDPFKLLVRDLSVSGIRLLHTTRPEGSHLALMWRTEEMHRVVVLVRIVRCEREGEFFDIGGAIVR